MAAARTAYRLMRDGWGKREHYKGHIEIYSKLLSDPISQNNITKLLCFGMKCITRVPNRDEWKGNMEMGGEV